MFLFRCVSHLSCPSLATMPFAGYVLVHFLLSAFPVFFVRTCSRFDMVSFHLSCDHDWIRIGSVDARLTTNHHHHQQSSLCRRNNPGDDESTTLFTTFSYIKCCIVIFNSTKSPFSIFYLPSIYTYRRRGKRQHQLLDVLAIEFWHELNSLHDVDG